MLANHFAALHRLQDINSINGRLGCQELSHRLHSEIEALQSASRDRHMFILAMTENALVLFMKLLKFSNDKRGANLKMCAEVQLLGIDKQCSKSHLLLLSSQFEAVCPGKGQEAAQRQQRSIY